jgi:hypothetical protein
MSAFTAQFKIEGIPRLKKRIKLYNLAGLPIRNFLRDYADEVVQQSKKAVPVDSGRLRNGIQSRPIFSVGRIPDQITVHSFSKHASFVHGVGPKHKTTEPWARTKPHWPPAKPLTAWGPVKSGQIPVYLVQKAIAEKGTPLVPYLIIGVKNAEPKKKLLLKRTALEIELAYKAGRKVL